MEGNAHSPEVRATIAPKVTQRVEVASQKAAENYHAAHTATARDVQSDINSLKEKHTQGGLMTRLKQALRIAAAAAHLYVVSPADDMVNITSNFARTTQSQSAEVPIDFPRQGLAQKPDEIDPKRSVPAGSK